MTRSEEVIERAMKFVATSRAERERHMERRAELQRRAEFATVPPAYAIKKFGGIQLPLKLDS